MLDPSEYDDIIVTVAHPASDMEETLTRWIATGPGPRPFVRIVKARRKSSGEPVDMAEIPLEYHNTQESRRLQRLGGLPTPWGMPSDAEPHDMGIPPHIRRLVGE